MAGGAASPLLGSRPASTRSSRSGHSKHSNESHERTPLLSGDDANENPSYTTQQANGGQSPAALSLRSLQDENTGKGKGAFRWATIIALTVLCILVLLILALGFAAPAVVEDYAKQAVVFEPTKLSIDSFTSDGVRARIQGEFVMDASKVHKKAVRDLGKAGTWIAREVETGDSELKVYLPSYDNLLLGTAQVPKIKVNIRNGHTNHIDFLSDLQPGDIDGIRQIANDWLDGRLGQLEVKGITTLNLKSGIFKLGSQTVSQSMVFEGHDLPAFPKFDVSKLSFREVLQDGGKAMSAEASVAIANDYPVRVDVPRLSFDVLVPNCLPEQAYLLLAHAGTKEIEVSPRQPVDVSVRAIINELAPALTTACPGSHSSPLDLLLADYIQGLDTTIYVRGSESGRANTPKWITDLLKSVTVPLPFPGHSFDNLIRNFSLADVHFSLPNPIAGPNEPESFPRISAVVQALVGLPEEMNFPLDVTHVRADAEVFYHGKKLGDLDLNKWQQANTSRVNDTVGPGLLVQARVKDAPLQITDDDVFTEVVQALVFGSKGVILGVKAKVDVETVTALGDFIVRDIPAEGKVFVKPISRGGGFPAFKPTVGDLKILDTTKSSLVLQALVNVTNPTEYSAYVPYVNIHILNNDTVLAHATAKDITVVPGNNSNILVDVVWSPLDMSGDNGSVIGRDLLSRYVSGINTTLTLKTHEGSIPSQPALGNALSGLEIIVDTPQLKAPIPPGNEPDDRDDDDEEAGPRFIKDATMHLLSSSATFILLSPLQQTTLYITNISAVAYYNHTDPVGTIEYELPFAVSPGASTTPRLPVDWSLDGTGYDAVRDALGGSLKLDAKADAGVMIGKWEEQIWFVGEGIGAKIRL